jgi:hypothetical protein
LFALPLIAAVNVILFFKDPLSPTKVRSFSESNLCVLIKSSTASTLVPVYLDISEALLLASSNDSTPSLITLPTLSILKSTPRRFAAMLIA